MWNVAAATALTLIVSTSTCWGAQEAATTSSGGARSPRVVGYFAGWNAGRYEARDIPAAMLTHVNYAFAQIVDGRIGLEEEAAALQHFRGLRELKHRHPHLKTLVSVGGWTDSGPFSDAALTDASRATFAASCAAFASTHGFDGVDIDWEFPGGGGHDPTKGRPEDKRNFTLLLAEARRRLDAQGNADGKAYLLTIAAPASARHIKHIELGEIHRSLDFINLMTYDYAGPWSERTAFNAPLHAYEGAGHRSPGAEAAVRAYLDAGVPPDKLVLGVPFYGRAFGGVSKEHDGLGQPHDGKPPRAPAAGGWSYRNIAASDLGKEPTRHWHKAAKVPWLYDAKAGLFVTYDDADSIRHKAAFARERKLGGVMIWELSHDDAQSTLLRALHAGLTGN